MNEYMRMADRMYDLENQMKQLEKENAELKEKLRLSDLENHYCLPWCSKLTKAKEIITELLKYTDTEAVEMIKEAKQFLNSEVDK